MYLMERREEARVGLNDAFQLDSWLHTGCNYVWGCFAELLQAGFVAIQLCEA